MTTTIKIYRAVYSESIENIDMDNFGCHWSVSEIDTAKLMCSLDALDNEGKELFHFEAEISVDSINWEATAYSQINHPQEGEIVVNEKTHLNAVEAESGKEFSINTGTRVDEWVDTLDEDDVEYALEENGSTLEEFKSKLIEYFV